MKSASAELIGNLATKDFWNVHGHVNLARSCICFFHDINFLDNLLYMGTKLAIRLLFVMIALPWISVTLNAQ